MFSSVIVWVRIEQKFYGSVYTPTWRSMLLIWDKSLIHPYAIISLMHQISSYVLFSHLLNQIIQTNMRNRRSDEEMKANIDACVANEKEKKEREKLMEFLLWKLWKVAIHMEFLLPKLPTVIITSDNDQHRGKKSRQKDLNRREREKGGIWGKQMI